MVLFVSVLVLLAEGGLLRPSDRRVEADLRRGVLLKGGPKFSRLYADRFLLSNFFVSVVSDGVTE